MRTGNRGWFDLRTGSFRIVPTTSAIIAVRRSLTGGRIGSSVTTRKVDVGFRCRSSWSIGLAPCVRSSMIVVELAAPT